MAVCGGAGKGSVTFGGYGGYYYVDNNILVWDLESGENIRLFEGLTPGVTSLNLTPDGKVAVSASEKTLRVWDLQRGECIRILDEHRDQIWGVCITADGKLAISISFKKKARVWDLKNGECIAGIQDIGKLTVVSKITKSGDFVCAGESNAVIPLRFRNLPMGRPVVTAIRIWLYGKGGENGHWEDSIKAKCLWCGERAPVTDEILDVIFTILRYADLSADQSPCLELPEEAWDGPRLLAKCPHCQRPLKFNPFVVDNRGRY